MTEQAVLVYVVEDDPAHAEAVRRALEDDETAFEVKTILSISNFYQAVAEKTPELVVADLNLPDGTAFDLLFSPPESLPYPVLVMTSYGDEHLAVQVLKAGALDYIVKSQQAFLDMPHLMGRALREWNHMQNHKQAQQALRDSEERYRLLVEQAADGIFIANAKGYYTAVNPAGCAMLGFSAEEIIGKTISDLARNEDRKTAPLTWVTASIGETVRVERRLMRKDGSLLVVEISARRLNNGSTQSIMRDITERKMAEEALQESERRFRSLAESALVGIYLIDASGSCNYVNDAWCRISGQRMEKAYGHGWKETLHPDDQQALLSQLERLAKTNGKCEYEHRFIGTDGRITWVLGSLAPLRSVNGTLQGFVGVNIDITERKLAEEKLRESEERFRLLVEHAPEGIFVQTHKTFAYLNPTAFQWFGAQEMSQLVRQPVMDRFDSRYREGVDARMRRLNEENRAVSQIEEVCLRLDGTPFNVELGAVPIRWDGEIGALVFFRDITDRKRAEERLQIQSAALEAAANAIAITDREGNIEWINPAFTALTGYSAEEAQGLNPRALVRSGVHDREFYQALWDTVLAGNVWRGEIINRRKDGSLYTEEQTITPLLNSDGVVERFIAIKQDISERKKTQARLLESQQALMLSLQRMRVLHNIDLSIASKMELEEMTRIILSHIGELVGISAAALFIPHAESGVLQVAALLGFPRGTNPTDISLPAEYQTNDNVRELLPVSVRLLEAEDNIFIGEKILKATYRSCVILPLVILEQLKGVILFFSPHHTSFDPDWLDFLKSLAFQIAITLDRYSLFSSMEQANEKLYEAYEATLEGWSHALELRERETAGHSQRVVQLTVALAKAFGANNEEIQHIRRGALLHDIGKMGIPDNVLLKPGPLNDDEWQLMRQHPVLAQNLLATIPYLENSVNIPHLHHEKWDGSGYPFGLKGEEIPLAARIFAVVDVWDALLADRPYRKGWTIERTRQYLVDQKGCHFDPKVVDVFLKVLNAGADRSSS